MTRSEERSQRLMPNGVPRYVRCYDNGGETVDRYTVVFSGNYAGRARGWTDYLAMNGSPFSPQGFGQRGQHRGSIDRPAYGHLGKKIAFTDLPDDCQRLVLSDYRDNWQL